MGDPRNQFLQWFSIVVFGASAAALAAFVCFLLYKWSQLGKPISPDALPMVIFNALLPIIVGWIGLVLGYYFSDKAADAGASRALEGRSMGRAPLAEQLSGFRADQEMIPLSRIKKVVLKGGSDGRWANPFSELKEVVQEDGYTRAPMFAAKPDGDLIFHAIAHESVIYRFEAKMRAGEKDPDKLTIQDFLEDEKVKDAIGGTTAFVPRDATLQDARHAMEGRSGCQDVFVTTNGRETAPVEGWLSNVLILKRTVARAAE